MGRSSKYKLCSKCKKTKNIIDFYKNQKYCKMCLREYQINYRKSEVGKLNLKKYHKSEAHLKCVEKYHKSEKYRLFLEKNYTVNKDIICERQKRYRKFFPEKHRAREQVRRAIKNGSITKPNICNLCNNEKPIQGHHINYEDRLNVMWLCDKCHKGIHHGKIKI